ncbi:MAG: helix-turn-helix domain-containing protein [Lachnospiraceae bacterium]|nr:helix-turn-helix domain-containing protein [Lachnospiraceae bacterium]
MNMNIISKYLQFLRKSHNYTQDDLAEKLGISRQAVSKWETGTAIPDLEILLKISKLYDITINDILEPRIQPQRITDFEQISTIPEEELEKALKQFDANSLVTALMGASPQTNRLCERMFPDIDFEMIRNNIGRIRIETVEDMQNQIISMVNLQAVGEIESFRKVCDQMDRRC